MAGRTSVPLAIPRVSSQGIQASGHVGAMLGGFGRAPSAMMFLPSRNRGSEVAISAKQRQSCPKPEPQTFQLLGPVNQRTQWLQIRAQAGILSTFPARPEESREGGAHHLRASMRLKNEASRNVFVLH